MKVKSILSLLFVTITFVMNVSAQNVLNGYYVRPEVNKEGFFSYPSRFVLEFSGNRFYSYDYPEDKGGHLVCKSGTYLLMDTVLVLNFDTTVSISLNTGSLITKSINCYPQVTIGIQLSAQEIYIDKFPGQNYRSAFHIAKFDVKSPTYDWVKKYFRQKPYFKTKRCNAKNLQ